MNSSNRPQQTPERHFGHLHCRLDAQQPTSLPLAFPQSQRVPLRLVDKVTGVLKKLENLVLLGSKVPCLEQNRPDFE
jgi:hypothetical protein